MKTIKRRALSALLFGFLTLGGGASFAQEPTKTHACCSVQSCCGSECGTDGLQRGTSVNNQSNQWFKAKYGRDYPGTRPETQNTASHSCCNQCC